MPVEVAGNYIGTRRLAKLKNKSVLWLLLVGLLIIMPVLAACGQTTKLNDDESTIPHDLELGFENCLVCHTGGLQAVPANHNIYPLETCTVPGCHLLSGEVPPPPAAVVASHEAVGAYQDCLICHAVYQRYEFPVVTEHTILTNAVCVVCHEVAGG